MTANGTFSPCCDQLEKIESWLQTGHSPGCLVDSNSWRLNLISELFPNGVEQRRARQMQLHVAEEEIKGHRHVGIAIVG